MFIKVFVDVTWTTDDIWYVVTHEIKQDCLLLSAEMEFTVKEKLCKSSGLFHLVNIDGQMFVE